MTGCLHCASPMPPIDGNGYCLLCGGIVIDLDKDDEGVHFDEPDFYYQSDEESEAGEDYSDKEYIPGGFSSLNKIISNTVCNMTISIGYSVFPEEVESGTIKGKKILVLDKNDIITRYKDKPLKEIAIGMLYAPKRKAVALYDIVVLIGAVETKVLKSRDGRRVTVNFVNP